MPEIRYRKIPPPGVEGIPLPQSGPLGFLFDVLSRPVFAGENNQVPSFKDILRWKVPGTNTDLYINRVRSVLSAAQEAVVSRKTIPEPLHAMYRELIPALAWQESCFRQFHIKRDKVTYLLSYNQTSVGLMQINERIWRGIYDREQLRWNVRYNALAGAEILTLYLSKYIQKVKPPVMLGSASGKRFLAVWLYALYNGGPSQLNKLPKRYLKKQLYQSEELFLAKYDHSQGRDWTSQVTCLPVN